MCFMFSASSRDPESRVQQRGGGEAEEDDGGLSTNSEITETSPALLQSGRHEKVRSDDRV